MPRSKCNLAFDSLTDQGLCTDCYAETDDRRLEIVELARNEHQEDGEVEINGNAQLSEGTDNGCYVTAWVWVGFRGAKFDQDKEESKTPNERHQPTEPTR